MPAKLPDLNEDDWANVPVFGEEAPRPERLQAELATLPQPEPAKVSFLQAAKILGVAKSTVQQLAKKGTLHDAGPTAPGGLRLDRTEVDELAADRESHRFERKSSGTMREQHVLEQDLGVSQDPRVFGRDAGSKSEKARLERMHFENTQWQRRMIDAIEELTGAVRQAARDQAARDAGLQESLSALNTGLLVAAGVVGVAAVTPDDVKADLRKKVSDPFRRKAAAPALASAPAVEAAPAGPVRLRTIGGDEVFRAPLDEEDLREKSEALAEILKMRVEAPDGQRKG